MKEHGRPRLMRTCRHSRQNPRAKDMNNGNGTTKNVQNLWHCARSVTVSRAPHRRSSRTAHCAPMHKMHSVDTENEIWFSSFSFAPMALVHFRANGKAKWKRHLPIYTYIWNMGSLSWRSCNNYPAHRKQLTVVLLTVSLSFFLSLSATASTPLAAHSRSRRVFWAITRPGQTSMCNATTMVGQPTIAARLHE